MTHDRIVMAETEPTGEITKPRPAGFCSDAVERRAR
jgi:hypothetical protein